MISINMTYIKYIIGAIIGAGFLSIPISMFKEYLQVSYEHNKSNKLDKKLD